MNIIARLGVKQVVALERDDWAWGCAFKIVTDGGNTLLITTDKPGRAATLGAIPVESEDGRRSAWCLDRRVVAMVAEYFERIGRGDWVSPETGAEMRLPTYAEADAVFARIGIPQNPDDADDLFGFATAVGEDFNPI